MIRASITFTGAVQGVGFRYTTRAVAERFAITGWVRNEPDGSVRCIVEGDEPEVERFIAAVEQAMCRNIQSVIREVSPATGEFPDFTIRR